MTPLKDELIRAKIRDALCASQRGDCVTIKPQAFEEMKTLYPKMSHEGFVRMLKMWVKRGGVIDQVRETREGYRDRFEFHYDFRIPIGKTEVYIESCLLEDRPEDPELYIVRIKKA